MKIRFIFNTARYKINNAYIIPCIPFYPKLYFTDWTHMNNNRYPSGLRLVEEFHLVYGQKIRISPSMSEPERELRIALISEEIQELSEAIQQEDFIEVIDALADIVYVAYGAGLTHGLPVETRIITSLDLIIETENEQLISVGPQLKSHVNYIPSVPVFNENILTLYMEQLQEHLKKYIKAAETNNVTEATENLARIISTCYLASWSSGVDLDMVLEEVQVSNMSKLDSHGKPVYREDGKIIKGPNFFVPNIMKVLENQGYVKE